MSLGPSRTFKGFLPSVKAAACAAVLLLLLSAAAVSGNETATESKRACCLETKRVEAADQGWTGQQEWKQQRSDCCLRL